MPVGDDTHAYRRYLPHLQKRGKTYFVTFCTRQRRELSPPSRDIVLECCVRDHRESYWLHCAVVMPDHVHLIFTPHEGYELATIMSRVKSVSAHDINLATEGRGHVWQREYFDRMIRSNEDLPKKIDYVCQNPVRAGIAATIDEYPWIWRSWLTGGAPPRAAALH